MSTQAFSWSAEAAAWIVEKLENEPEAAHSVPILSFTYGYQAFDREWQVIQQYAAPFYILGWNSAEAVSAGDYLHIEIAGFKVFVSQDTLKRLEGKELILETVKVGVPTHVDKKCQLLRAATKEPSE